MKLTKDQLPMFWKLWAKACKTQGWDKTHGLNSATVDARRKEFLASLARFVCPDCKRVFHDGGKHEPAPSGKCDCGTPLQRAGFDSLTRVDPWEDFSLVKRELLKLDVKLHGALEEGDRRIESGRKARWFIEHDLMPCLALYVDDVEAYVAAVAEDKFRWRTRDGMKRRISLDDLSDDPVIREVRGELKEFASQLEQLKFTLSGRLNGKNGFRARAGHSVHDMRTQAGLVCRCARCRKSAKVTLASMVPVGFEEDDNNPF